MTTELFSRPALNPHADPSPRRPWLAALMSLVLPGYGQLYNGEVNRAIWLFLGFALLSVPGLVVAALYLPDHWTVAALAASLLASLGVWVYAVSNAWSVARRSLAYRLQPWQSSGFYLLVLLVCDSVVLPMLIGYVRTQQVEAFKIPSSSMAPTLLPGDFLFADKRYNCPQCKRAVRRNDVAIFVYPNDRTMYFVKRIVGLPGDHIELRNQQFFVNGVLLPMRAQPATIGLATAASSAQPQASVAPETLEVTVAAGTVFVLGDNQQHSQDSRQFGSVPLHDVVGRVRQVWFSWGEGGVRWSRLGSTPE